MYYEVKISSVYPNTCHTRQKNSNLQINGGLNVDLFLLLFDQGLCNWLRFRDSISSFDNRFFDSCGGFDVCRRCDFLLLHFFADRSWFIIQIDLLSRLSDNLRSRSLFNNLIQDK